MHSKVKRLTSTASGVSAVSGFSDDFQDDDNDESRMMNAEGRPEYREYGSISFSVYWGYLRAGGLNLLGFFVVLSILLHSVKVYLDYLLRDAVVENISFESALYTFRIYGGLSFIVILLTYCSNLLGQWIGAGARKNLHERMINNLFNCSIDLFDAFPIGRILNRLSCDMFVIDQKLPSCLQRLVLVSLICAAALLVNCIQNPVFLIFCLPMLVFYWWIQHFYRCSSRELQRIESISNAPIFSHISDTLAGLVTIRSFRVAPQFINELCEKIDSHSAASLIHQSGCRWLGLTLDLTGAMIVFISIFISAILSTGSKDPGISASLGLSMSYIMLVPIYLAWVIKFVADIENYMNAVDRVLDYIKIDKEKDIETVSINQSICETHLVPQQNKDQVFKSSRIQFENVYLGYHLETRTVVPNLNLCIPQGQKIALCGRSGSGKSTIAMALARMAQTIQGNITIDGISIHSVPLKTVREFVCVVHQEAAVFSGTIRSNLDPEERFTDSEMWLELEKLGLKNSILLLEHNLDSTVNEGGNNLSQGLRQQICIARCYLRKPKLLILDEATSSVDVSLENTIYRNLLENLPNCTIITIVHRLVNILQYDRVIVLGEGRIQEDGCPRVLLGKPMGFFSALWRKENGRELRTVAEK
ncbi:ATP-binding cassette sub-family C member Sur isoform X2 [Eurytemora carolleeae]|uniref:ATP-binding cassette sub-family C member Sur isoform X2 n=1 Tax=Eurytemora carolleeae TaxID=1294199 RepID=UPI000C75F175|nr:ATP-binding cassette sub-family C member Sur isoform X2 [Eurytemora carolleeae]|eukprot:XP_023349445.1 ATP-binding cassette sub-family C member Sur-like isoform X2 [Eurytemora affinis]